MAIRAEAEGRGNDPSFTVRLKPQVAIDTCRSAHQHGLQQTNLCRVQRAACSAHQGTCRYCRDFGLPSRSSTRMTRGNAAVAHGCCTCQFSGMEYACSSLRACGLVLARMQEAAEGQVLAKA